MAIVQPPEGPFYSTTTNTNTAGTVRYSIEIGGKQVDAYVPGTVTSFTAAPPDTSVQDSYLRLTDAFKKLTAALGEKSEPADQGQVEGEGEEKPAPPGFKKAYVTLENRIGDIVYGSTEHAPTDIAIGDMVTLHPHHGDDMWYGVAVFIEGESIGYRVTWP